MTDTPRLEVTEHEQSQALQVEVANEAYRVLEAFGNATHFKSRTTTAQPGSPADGDVYLLPASSTGADWAGHDGEIAIFVNTAWVFKDAKEGFLAWIDDDDELLVYDGAAWSPPIAGISELDDVPDVNAPAPSNGDVLTWDSTPGEWVAQALPGAGAFVLGDATDVDTTGASTGDVLTFDGAQWEPGPAGGGGKTLITTIDYGAAASASNDVNIRGYDEIWLEFDGLTVGAGEFGFRLSANAGSSYFSAGTDYTMSADNQTVGESNIDRSAARIGSGAGTGVSGGVQLRNLNQSGSKVRYTVQGSLLVGASGMGWGRCNQTGGPFDRIRILNVSGNNSTAGKIEVWGR
jgi:hypothetical protein